MCRITESVVMYQNCGDNCPRIANFTTAAWGSLGCSIMPCSLGTAAALRRRERPDKMIDSKCGVDEDDLKPDRVIASWGSCHTCKKNGWVRKDDNHCDMYEILSWNELLHASILGVVPPKLRDTPPPPSPERGASGMSKSRVWKEKRKSVNSRVSSAGSFDEDDDKLETRAMLAGEQAQMNRRGPSRKDPRQYSQERLVVQKEADEERLRKQKERREQLEQRLYTVGLTDEPAEMDPDEQRGCDVATGKRKSSHKKRSKDESKKKSGSKKDDCVVS